MKRTLAYALCALKLSACGGSTTTISGSVPGTLSVDAAQALCRSHNVPRHAVTVAGYYRHGPILNGPIVLLGAVFQHNNVPLDAAEGGKYPPAYHAVGFAVDQQDPLADAPVLHRVLDRSHLLVTGTLRCIPGAPSLAPTSIRIVPSHV